MITPAKLFWSLFNCPPRVVFANGCFDVLHAGHLHLLKEAKSFGDRLVVGINSDASVCRLKGQGRPIHNQQQRTQQLLLLPWVDQVLVFDEPTPLELIKAVKPHIIVKGGDYSVKEVVGNDLAEVRIVSTLPGFSTSSTVAKILNQG